MNQHTPLLLQLTVIISNSTGCFPWIDLFTSPPNISTKELEAVAQDRMVLKGSKEAGAGANLLLLLEVK